jgi:hypothetical protein
MFKFSHELPAHIRKVEYDWISKQISSANPNSVPLIEKQGFRNAFLLKKGLLERSRRKYFKYL